MTNRQLEGEEKEVSEKQLKKRKEELEKFKLNLEYNKDLIKKQKFLQELDDKWRIFLRGRKDDEDIQIIKSIEFEIDNTDKMVKLLEKQLNEGIEVPTGVN